MGVREQGAGGGVTAGRAQVSGQAIAPAALRALLAACGVSEAAYAGILSTYSAAQQAEVLRLLETARRLAEVAAEEPAAAAAAAAAGVMEELRCALGDVRCFPDHYQRLVDICHHSGLRVGGADPVLALLVAPPALRRREIGPAPWPLPSRVGWATRSGSIGRRAAKGCGASVVTRKSDAGTARRGDAPCAASHVVTPCRGPWPPERKGPFASRRRIRSQRLQRA